MPTPENTPPHHFLRHRHPLLPPHPHLNPEAFKRQAFEALHEVENRLKLAEKSVAHNIKLYEKESRKAKLPRKESPKKPPPSKKIDPTRKGDPPRKMDAPKRMEQPKRVDPLKNLETFKKLQKNQPEQKKRPLAPAKYKEESLDTQAIQHQADQTLYNIEKKLKYEREKAANR